MKLCDAQYEYIKEEVIDLFVRYDVRCIPISGFELALKMGISVIPYSALDEQQHIIALRVSEDGFYLEPGNGKEIIYYNDLKGYQRSNMTILHEIGHCALGHDNLFNSDIAEAEAKFFAKYAIAPPPLVDIMKPISAEELMDVFDLSYEAGVYAWSYYQKWKRKIATTRRFTQYERRIIELFKTS